MKLNNNVLIVGQTPPPFGGQAIIINNILHFLSDYDNVYHVKMNFANEMDDIGKFQFTKILKIIPLVLKIWIIKIRKNANLLYFPSSGGEKKGPLYRDLLVLLFTQFLFRKVVIHFHAGGLEKLFNSLNFIEKAIFKLAYSRVSDAIISSKRLLNDSNIINPDKTHIFPLGIKDAITTSNMFPRLNQTNANLGVIKLLFVSVLKESKGIFIFLEVCKNLRDKGIKFQAHILGKSESTLIEEKIFSFIEKYSLQNYIVLAGVKVDLEKYYYFYNSHIFCFPTFFESETFGVVNIEAMMFSLPIISTEWRGIPDIVEDGVNGYLCPIRDVDTFQQKVEVLIKNNKLRNEFGENSRRMFLEKYEESIFKDNLIRVFTN